MFGRKSIVTLEIEVFFPTDIYFTQYCSRTECVIDICTHKDFYNLYVFKNMVNFPITENSCVIYSISDNTY